MIRIPDSGVRTVVLSLNRYMTLGKSLDEEGCTENVESYGFQRFPSCQYCHYLHRSLPVYLSEASRDNKS